MRAFYEIGGVAEAHVQQEERHRAVVSFLYVNPRRRGGGAGAAIMRWICQQADVERVTLELEPIPFGRWNEKRCTFEAPHMTQDELRAWYRQFGFRNTLGSWMIRGPRKVR